MDDPYARLLEQRRNEGAVRGLAKLPRDFYPATASYLEETRRAFESELRENPSSRRGEISRQTFQRASQAARDLIEARMSKLIGAAFQASVGGARDLPNALSEERELFDRVVQSLIGFRRATAPFLEPGGPFPAPGAMPPPETSGSSRPPSASARPTELPARDPTTRSSPRLAYVRILKESRPIRVGNDTVDLRKEDILSVPLEVADLLVKGHVAETLRPGGPGPVT